MKTIALCFLKLFSCAALTLFILLSCSNFKQTKKNWTLAFYFCGDNALGKAQQRNVNEILRGCDPETTNVIIFLVQDVSSNTDFGPFQFKGTRLFQAAKVDGRTIAKRIKIQAPVRIGLSRWKKILAKLSADEAHILKEHYHTKDNCLRFRPSSDAKESNQRVVSLLRRVDYALPVLTDGSNLKAASAKTIRQFFSYVRDNYISERYAFFINSHGQGWFPAQPLAHTPPHGFLKCREFFAPLLLKDIANGLAYTPCDVLVLDMCFMGNIETVYELKGQADYLSACQSRLPADGLDYEVLLSKLRDPSFKPADLAAAVGETYKETYQNSQYSVSTTVIHYNQSFDKFSAEFNALFEQTKFCRKARRIVHRTPQLSKRLLNGDQMVDLLSFLNKSGQKRLVRLARQFIKQNYSTIQGANSLSIYFPRFQRPRPFYDKAYQHLDFYRDFCPGWYGGVLKNR